MNQPNVLIKGAAIASSLLLFCGFVLYRAGALTWLTTPAPASHASVAGGEAASPILAAQSMPDSPQVQSFEVHVATPTRQDTVQLRTYISGSKSMAPLITPSEIDTSGPAEPLPQHGTASDVPPPWLKPEPVRATATITRWNDSEPRRPDVMSSSKSMVPLFRPSDAPKPLTADSSAPKKHTP